MPDTKLSVRYSAPQFENFFDRGKIEKLFDRVTRKAMVRIGGQIRTIARRSMRPGGKKGATANRGEAPRWHTRLLKDRLFFAYDPDSHVVVIGPQIVFGTKNKQKSNKTVPQLLEEGGQATHRTGFLGKMDRLSYDEHPYMEPALRKSIDRGDVREAWRAII